MRLQFKTEERILNTHEAGVPYLSFGLLDDLGVPNLYSTRYLSKTEQGLRVALMSDDNPDEVAPILKANRDLLERQLGTSIEMECVTDQQHTANVFKAVREDLGFCRNADLPEARRNVDGLVTDVENAVLVVFGADCPTVYIVDPVHKAIGLVHAGWKGTLGRIPAVAISMMQEEYGSRPEEMFACVGPGICQDCYEMGDEIYDLFEAEWSHEDAEALLKRYPARDETSASKYHLDLMKANYMTIRRAGIPEANIAVSNLCTCCNKDELYSYRARRMENEQVAMLVNRFK